MSDDVVGGKVGGGELARLSDALGAPGPTLVVGHHCPVAIGCPWLDVHRIEDGEALMRVLLGAAVPAYVFGHIHQEAERGLADAAPGHTVHLFPVRGGHPRVRRRRRQTGLPLVTFGPRMGTVATEVRRIVDFPMTINLMDRGHR